MTYGNTVLLFDKPTLYCSKVKLSAGTEMLIWGMVITLNSFLIYPLHTYNNIGLTR